MMLNNMDTIEKIFSNLRKCICIDQYFTHILAIMSKPYLIYLNLVNNICNYHKLPDKKRSQQQTKERKTYLELTQV